MNDDILWKQYSLYIDLYRYYMDLTIKVNLFYYGITGAILSFYFTHTSTPLVKLSLGLPILMSLVFSGIFFYGAHLMHILREDVFDIRDQLKLATAPDIGILTIALRAFASLMLIVAISMGILISRAV